MSGFSPICARPTTRCCADILHHPADRHAGAAMGAQLVDQRFDAVEGFGDALLVTREDDATRQHGGGEQQPFAGRLAQADMAIGAHRLLGIGLDLDPGGLDLGRGERL
jgi:hypothetical protein